MFIARTRFSLFIPNSNGWNISRNKEDIVEYKNKLYEEKRLNIRINFLSHIMLPLLEKASKNYKLLHVIEYSETLPNKYIALLKELEENYSFVKLNLYDDSGIPEKKINTIAIDYFDLKSYERDVWIGKFVLDDDDCISLKYFKVMSQYLTSCFEHFYISMGLGVVGVFDENNNFIHCAEMYKPKINIGLMNVGRYSCKDKKIYFTSKGTAHMSMDKVNPVILDSREVGFYWSRHHHQDTRLNKTQQQVDKIISSLKALPEFNEEQFNENFGSDFYRKLQNFDKNGNFVK